MTKEVELPAGLKKPNARSASVAAHTFALFQRDHFEGEDEGRRGEGMRPIAFTLKKNALEFAPLRSLALPLPHETQAR